MKQSKQVLVLPSKVVETKVTLSNVDSIVFD